MKKKLLCIVLITLMLLSTACGKKVETTSVPEVNSNFNAEGLPILKEPETFTIAVQQVSPLKSAKEKKCVIDAEKATNIKIEWNEIPAASWKEKINVMISTNNLPDAIIGGVENMSTNYEMFVSLNDSLNKYAPNVTKFFDSRDDYPQSLQAPDGTIRALPGGDESYQNKIMATPYMKNDWLTKLNLKLPTTTDSLEKVLIAFRDGDGNGNGKKDEVPLVFGSLWSGNNAMGSLFGSFGVLENTNHVFINKQNKVVLSCAEDGYYEALKYFHKLYSEGLIYKDAFTVSWDQYKSNIKNSDAYGMVIMYGEDTIHQGATGWSGVPILAGPKGDKMVNETPSSKNGGFQISTNCKNPVALVRWYDYINSTEELALSWGRGKEGEWYDWVNVNGVKTCQFNTMTKEVLDKLGYTSAAEYRSAESFAGVTPSLWRISYDEAKILAPGTKVGVKTPWIKDSIQYGFISLPVGNSTTENEKRRSILLADIENYLTRFVANSIINGISDEDWKKHLNTLNSLKAYEYRDLCQEYVNSRK